MTELVAASIGVLLEKAISAAGDRIVLVLGFRFHKDLAVFQEHAKDIQAVLADAERKQSRNPFVLRWLHKVEAAAVEADYMLDELLYESFRRKVESMKKPATGAKVCLFFSLSKHDVSFRWRMSSKVREMNEMFKKFILEVPGIGLIRMEDSTSQVGMMAKTEVVTSRETNSLPQQFVAGRVKEVSEIVGMLSTCSSEVVSVLSIVGMGGLGKTTLAKSIYNNQWIKSHFGERIWVCVSNKFEATEILRLVLESLKKEKVAMSSQDAIVKSIREELAGKRFLLVLDDVWNEDHKLWDDFFTSLVGVNSASGSCCLVTTRLRKTANLVSTFDPFVLDKLADDECWYILCRRAIKKGEMPQQFDVYRNKILQKCQGLPLAANAVGGLLSLQKREDWLSVVENKILKMGDYVEGEITPILKLSFDYLPSLSIKKCFAYCSMFSKDAKIHGQKLVALWMAEGFLQEGAGVERRTMMEEVGDSYLTVLLQSSLLEKVNDEDGEDIYQMHDLVHDLAECVSKRKQIDEYNSQQVHHLVLASQYTNTVYNERSSLVRIMKDGISEEVFMRYNRLHVLEFFGISAKNLPNSIGKLKHLRYLSVSDSEIEFLPESLCKLYNLQTLLLDDCLSLQCLPQGLSNLISLRHVHFYQENRRFKMPPNMGHLTCLQTLNFFNVGEEKGHEIKELGSMKNLRGMVKLRNLELVRGKGEARLANLLEKHDLVGLELCWGSEDCHDIDNCNDEHVLEGLEPHPNLHELRLRNYMGARLPQWFGKLKVLTKLRFNYCKSLKDLPTLGHLPYLEDLVIKGLEHVTFIGDSFYFDGSSEGEVFPSLKSMKLQSLPNLIEWKELDAGNGLAFSKLESLHIRNCCQLASVPTSFPSLKTLKIVKNIRVSVVRDIIGKSASLLKKLIIGSMSGLESLADVIENHLTCLEKLRIYRCGNLIEIPSSTLERCTSLRELTLESCPKLMSCALDLQRTPSLSSLWFYECPNMFTGNAMPRGFKFLTNLTKLAIGPFTDDSIQRFDWQGLIACSSTIQFLQWCGSLQEHSCLPQQLQHLTSINVLSLTSLNSAEALPDWLGNFTTLMKLELRDCPKLQHLPSAHAMARLTNLRKLVIYNCPLLLESSIQDISSLPNLEIRRK